MRIVTANKLNRLWKNGFLPKLGLKIDKTKVLTTVEQVAANTNAENVAGATAVKTIYNNLTSQLPGGVKILAEGSGADVKYYAQIGADTASKKLLGNAKIKAAYIEKGATTYTLTADSGYKFITAFLNRWITSDIDNFNQQNSQYGFWSEEYGARYTACQQKNLLDVSNDRKILTCTKLDASYRFYICGVEVPD